MAIFNLPNQSFRWLAAELTVVVVGILIAFQVDSWRETISSRTQEQQYLTDMILDLQKDSVSLEGAIKQRQQRLPAIRELIVLLTDPLTSQESESKVLELENNALDGSIASFIPNTITFDKVQQSGKLAVVRDNQLYQYIIEYYAFYGINSDINAVQEWLAPWRQISLELYGPLQFVQTYDFRNGAKYRLPNEEQSRRSIDILARRKNTEYMGFLGDMFQSQAYYEVRWQEILDRNIQLQESIRKYLNSD